MISIIDAAFSRSRVVVMALVMVFIMIILIIIAIVKVVACRSILPRSILPPSLLHIRHVVSLRHRASFPSVLVI